MGIELDELLTLLHETGKYSPEQIEEFAALHMAVKYEPETLEIPKPDFWFESDKEVLLGNKKVLIRFINGWDIGRLTPKIKNIMIAVNGSKDIPKRFDPVSFAAAAFDQAITEHASGKRTPLVYTLFEELAIMASTDKQEISTAYLFACPIGHIKNFIVKFIEVNQADFLELWGVHHKNIGSVIVSLIGKASSLIAETKTKLNMGKGPAQGSIGGSANTGLTMSGSQSKKKREAAPVA